MTRKKMIPVVLLALAGAREAGARTTTNPCVTIYLHSTGLMDSYSLHVAEQTAAIVYSDIGVSLEWIHSALESDGETCMAINIQFQRDLPEKFHTGTLAYALPYANGGTQIYVGVDRVQRFPGARQSFVAAQQKGAFLRYVMAHEIAHVLQRIDRHSTQEL